MFSLLFTLLLFNYTCLHFLPTPATHPNYVFFISNTYSVSFLLITTEHKSSQEILHYRYAQAVPYHKVTEDSH